MKKLIKHIKRVVKAYKESSVGTPSKFTERKNLFQRDQGSNACQIFFFFFITQQDVLG